MTGVPMVHGAERVLEIIEHSGGLVVGMENCTGLKPILEDVDETAADPLRALAEKYFHLPCSVMTPQRPPARRPAATGAEYRPECVVELIWQACLTYDVESHRVRRLAEEELGLPVSAHRDRLLAVRFGRGSRCASRPCSRRSAAGGSRRTPSVARRGSAKMPATHGRHATCTHAR